MDNVTVVDQAERSRFEARTPDGTVVGFIDYRPARYAGESSAGDDAAGEDSAGEDSAGEDSATSDLEMIHTEVATDEEGQGIGTQLVREALDQVRASGRGVMPLCAFVSAFIRDNPAYQDLVRTEAGRGQGG